MARIKPRVHGYSPGDFLVPADLQAEINKHFARTFSDDDFMDMSVALAVGDSVWRTRKAAPDRELVIKHLKKVRETADRLLRLLLPTSGLPEEPIIRDEKRLTAAEDAISRLKAGSIRKTQRPVRGDRDNLPVVRQVVQETYLALGFLKSLAAAEIDSVKSLRAMSSGQDSDHIDSLLKDLLPILRRNNLSDSYTTIPQKDHRRAPAVDLARLLVPLWPSEVPRPTEDAVMSRLVKIRAEINKRTTN